MLLWSRNPSACLKPSLSEALKRDLAGMWARKPAFFVVRTKSNVLIQRRYSHPVDKTTGVCSDQTVILTSFESASAYPDALRRGNYLDKEIHKRLNS
jgi:hypothetical protein